MKRSSGLRKTKGLKRSPLVRGTSKLKRTKLNRISKDERRRIRERTPARNEYKLAHPVCECERDCGGVACELHEIAAGQQHKWKAASLASCWLHLHWRCHDRLQGRPYVVQLGAKLYHSPETFDLAEFLSVIGRKPTAIDIQDVVAAMPRNPPDIDECTLKYQHYKLKVKLLTRQLNEATKAQNRWAWDLHQAQKRAAAVAAADQKG